jgi:hypothetical protein
LGGRVSAGGYGLRTIVRRLEGDDSASLASILAGAVSVVVDAIVEVGRAAQAGDVLLAVAQLLVLSQHVVDARLLGA